jgi:hypothetical protein
MKTFNKAYAVGLCFLASVLPIAAQAAGEGGGADGLLRTLTVVAVIVSIFLILAAAWYSLLWMLRSLKRSLRIEARRLDQSGGTR